MLKLSRVTKVKVLFLVLVLVFNFELIQFSAAILEKGLLVDLEPICGEHLSAGVLFSKVAYKRKRWQGNGFYTLLL